MREEEGATLRRANIQDARSFHSLDPLPMVLKMLSARREDDPLVETVHLPVHPAKAKEFVKLLDDLIAPLMRAYPSPD